MIKTESEYKEARTRLQAEEGRIKALCDRLVEQGLDESSIKRVTDPLYSFHIQLKEEVESYEQIKRGDFAVIKNLKEFGRILIGLRIFAGLSQRKLSELLGVDESQISRDERNEYRSITIDRAAKIIEMLNAQIELQVVPQHKDTSNVEFANA